MAKTYNAFLKHITQMCHDMDYTRPLSQFDMERLYTWYLSKPSSSFKDNVRNYIRHLKAER